MIKNIINKFIVKEYKFKYLIFSIISGILLALSFQKFNFYIFAWVALIPLIFCIHKNNLKKLIIYSFVTGFVFDVIYLYWMVPFLLLHTDKIFDSCCVSIITWLYFSLYFVVWAIVFYLSRNKINNKIFFSIFIAGIWTILDFSKTYLLTGLSWNLLAYTQASFLYLIQICDIFGVYVISFVIVFVNMLLYFYIESKKRTYLIVSLVSIFLLCGYGYLRINSLNIENGKKLSVGVVQPNVEQKKKWEDKYKGEIIASIEKLVTEKFKDKNFDLVVYPETMLPGYLRKDPVLKDLVKNISSFGKVNLIGGIDIRFSMKKQNSVFVTSQEGEIVGKYNKNYLIIFGEYLPFEFILSKILTNLNTTGEMVKEGKIKIVKEQNLSFGINICSENYYSSLSRKLALLGAEIFTTHVNDAWFDGTSAIDQHFVLNIFRAIESRKYSIVSANTGISGIIAPTGKVISKTKNQEQTVLEGTVYTNNYITIYDKIGDLFVYLCILYAIIAFLVYGIFWKKEN